MSFKVGGARKKYGVKYPLCYAPAGKCQLCTKLWLAGHRAFCLRRPTPRLPCRTVQATSTRTSSTACSAPTRTAWRTYPPSCRCSAQRAFGRVLRRGGLLPRERIRLLACLPATAVAAAHHSEPACATVAAVPHQRFGRRWHLPPGARPVLPGLRRVGVPSSTPPLGRLQRRLLLVFF